MCLIVDKAFEKDFLPFAGTGRSLSLSLSLTNYLPRTGQWGYIASVSRYFSLSVKKDPLGCAPFPVVVTNSWQLHLIWYQNQEILRGIRHRRDKKRCWQCLLLLVVPFSQTQQFRVSCVWILQPTSREVVAFSCHVERIATGFPSILREEDGLIPFRWWLHLYFRVFLSFSSFPKGYYFIWILSPIFLASQKAIDFPQFGLLRLGGS